jgi:PAS domain S-box-containing protein
MKQTYRPAQTRNIGRWTLYLMGLLGTLLVLSLAGTAYRSWRAYQLVDHLVDVNQASQVLFNAADQLVHEQVYTRIMLSQPDPPPRVRLHQLASYRQGVEQALAQALESTRKVDPSSSALLEDIERLHQALGAARQEADSHLRLKKPEWDEILLQRYTLNSSNLLDKLERLMVYETRSLNQTDNPRIDRLVAVGLNALRIGKYVGQTGSGMIAEANRGQAMPQAELLSLESGQVRAQASLEQVYDNALDVHDAHLNEQVRRLVKDTARLGQLNSVLAERRGRGDVTLPEQAVYEKTVLDTIARAREVHDLSRSMISAAFTEQLRDYRDALILNILFVLLGVGLTAAALVLLRSRVLKPLVRLQLILDVATDAIITLDDKLQIRMINKGAERLFDTTLGQVMWEPIDTLLTIKPAQREALTALTHGPGEFRGDAKACRGDKWINVSLTAAPIQVTDVSGVLLIIRDVHARKLVEESLSRSLKLIKTISNLQNRIFTQSQRSEVYRELLQVLLEHTDSRYGFIGLVREPIVGRACVVVDEMAGGTVPPKVALRRVHDEAPLQQIIPLDRLLDLAVLMREPVCFERGKEGLALLAEIMQVEPGTLENFMLLPVMVKGLLVAVVGIGQRPQGYSNKLAGEIEPLLGAYASMVAYFHEEDAKRLSEQHLQQVSQQQAAIFSTSPVGLMIVRDYRVYRANSAASEIFGGGEEGLVGWRLNELLVNEDDTSRLIALLELSAQETQSEALELQCMRAGSVPFWARLHARPLDAQRPELGFVMACIDMAEQKQTEAMLRRAKEAADEASHAKSAFLATMSHEIRTPMNGVIGMLELLSLSRLDDEQRDTLDTAQTSARSLLRLIDEILDFSKIEAGRLEIVPEVTSLPDIVQRVQQLHLENASRKGLALITLIDPAVHPVVKADEFRLSQILNNFVSNALKFTMHGEVGIALKLVSKAADRQTVAFEVADSGIGMSAEGIQRLFEPFTQAESDTTRRFGGTGLGLAICKRLAELMGGRVEIESVTNQGTTVSLIVTLPLASREALAAQQPQAEAVQPLTQALPILFAEDNPTNRKLIAKQLTLLGLEVVTAEDGVDALEKWHAGQFALILTDCHMPHMNGYQLATAVREVEKEEGRARMLIIACTANASREEAAQCLAAGMDDFLTKPLTIGKLSQTLAKWLGQQPQTEAAPALAVEPPETIAAAPELPIASEDSVQALDRAQLAVYSDGDLNIEQEILREFWASNSDDVQALRAAYTEWDFPGMVKWAHRVKGAARMVGAEPLGSAAQVLEETAKQQDRAVFEARLAEFNGELDRLAFALAELGVLPADVS